MEVRALYLASHGDAVISAGSAEIWAQGLADITLFTAGNSVHATASANVSDLSGGSNTLETCGETIFDLSNAPSPGCQTVCGMNGVGAVFRRASVWRRRASE